RSIKEIRFAWKQLIEKEVSVIHAKQKLYLNLLAFSDDTCFYHDKLESSIRGSEKNLEEYKDKLESNLVIEPLDKYLSAYKNLAVG
ncbi:hypothetical protein Ciccas_007664, partial [Cichlidogyrus casuarinus]